LSSGERSLSDYRELGLVRLSDLRLRLTARQLVTSVVIVSLTSTIAVWGEPLLGIAGAALTFVLGVMVVGALNGLAAALVAAAIAFLIYNFFLAEPFLSFRLASGRDAVPFVAFNLVALVAGVLAGRLQDRASAAQRASLQLASLLETSQDLQSAVTPDDVLSRLPDSAPARLGLALGVHRPRENGELAKAAPDIVRRAWASAQPVAAGREIAVTLRGATGPVGVLVATAPDAARAPDPQFLQAYANLLAIALERALLSSRIAEAAAAARSEQLKTALLASVSHDWRTPLSTITASASSLLEYGAKLTPDVQAQLLRSIVDEGERLNRYTANLLELSKLQAGVAAPAQPIDVVEIVAAAVQRMTPRAGRRRIETRLAAMPTVVMADPTLFELAVVNVIANAIAYSPDDSAIRVGVAATGGEAMIDVYDQGVGIPPADLERVFVRFQRIGKGDANPRGMGLGLAIARGFVEAFGGRIWANSPVSDGRGTRIAIRLPLAQLAAA
jgi:two-component system sensor histidine kinase KdpD